MPVTLHLNLNDTFNSSDSILTKYSENVYSLKINAKKGCVNGFFEPISQIKFKQNNIMHTATLYYDGIYYIELENENSIYKKKIIDAENVILKAENINDNSFLAVYGNVKNKKYCLFFGYDEDYKILGEYYADNVVIDKDITLTLELNDMCQNTQEIKLEYDGNVLTQKEKKVTAKKSVKNIDKLIPFYFLEAIKAENFDMAKSLLHKENYKDVEAVQFINFFGDFDIVLQNSYEKKYVKYVAIRKKISDCYYELKYYDFVICDGIIENIIELQNKWY